MFDIGFFEMLVVGTIALMVLGPERLPEAVVKTGRMIGQIKRQVRQFTVEIEREVNTKEIKEKLKQTRYEVGVDQMPTFSEFIEKDSLSHRFDSAERLQEKRG
ncbi:Sec-independent protein translocase protein TatB [Microbulbifer pacificus]|uniref:Sec-independent protein translocase protein TatB n=1 Tax=Microbulbifer pacificus TaxID=407164 RepID=A0AAU0MYQ1_9GAMM|nr:Sec-independent protein translocase protein TatB [Microbulbifer pacificus]WOX05143.1 Sec-independent protein translocase protein TatB [Microbulbifer pacificus]